jgi:hypothetical protein
MTTTNRNLEIAAPAKASDASSEQKAPEQFSVQFPTTTQEKNSWKTDLVSMDAKKGSADSVLPPFALTSNDQFVAFSGGKDNPGVAGAEKPKLAGAGGKDNLRVVGANDKPELAALAGPEKIDRDGDGKADDPEGPTSSVLAQLAKLQEAERSLGDGGPGDHSDEDKKADTGRTAHGEANVHAHEFHAEVAQKNDELKDKQLTELISSRFGGSLGDLTSLSDDTELMVRALSGDVVTPPHEVSIYNLEVSKDLYGRVVLIAPAGDNDRTKEVVQDRGKPVSAMELGQYLRPDGTILLGKYGQVVRPGEKLEAILFNATDGGKSDSESQLTEISTVSENIDQELIAQNYLSISANNPLGKNRLDMNPVNLYPLDLEKQRIEFAKESNSESRLENRITSDQTRVTEVAQSETQEHRSILTRLGETLRSIALRELNDVKTWTLLARMNKIPTDIDARGAPLAALQKGTRLQLPSSSEIEDFQETLVALRNASSSGVAPAPV